MNNDTGYDTGASFASWYSFVKTHAKWNIIYFIIYLKVKIYR